MAAYSSRAGGGGEALRLGQVVFADSPLHFIAERHSIDLVISETQLQKSWESAVAFCGTIHCEVVSCTIGTRTADTSPSGKLVVRVVPEDLGKWLSYLERLGKIAEHSTEREDKTTEVVDTDAKIKNLTAFRDNLRAMLAKPSAKVSDLVEIQKQLTDTQSQLDSEIAQRKILANETEKISVQISFRVERSGANAGGFSEIWRALRESGSTLADSTASLLYTIFAILPWLILIIPAIWLLVRLWRKLKPGRKSPPAT